MHIILRYFSGGELTCMNGLLYCSCAFDIAFSYLHIVTLLPRSLHSFRNNGPRLDRRGRRRQSFPSCVRLKDTLRPQLPPAKRQKTESSKFIPSHGNYKGLSQRTGRLDHLAHSIYSDRILHKAEAYQQRKPGRPTSIDSS